MSNNDKKEEELHFQQVCASYQQYATYHQVTEQGVTHRRERLLSYMNTVEDGEPSVASILQQTFSQEQMEKSNQKVLKSLIRNQFMLDNVLKHAGAMTSQEVLQNRNQFPRDFEVDWWASEEQISKIDSVLKSIYRDWSNEGKEERSVVYDKLLGALEKYLPNGTNDRGPPRVAVNFQLTSANSSRCSQKQSRLPMAEDLMIVRVLWDQDNSTEIHRCTHLPAH